MKDSQIRVPEAVVARDGRGAGIVALPRSEVSHRIDNPGRLGIGQLCIECHSLARADGVHRKLFDLELKRIFARRFGLDFEQRPIRHNLLDQKTKAGGVMPRFSAGHLLVRLHPVRHGRAAAWRDMDLQAFEAHQVHQVPAIEDGKKIGRGPKAANANQRVRVVPLLVPDRQFVALYGGLREQNNRSVLSCDVGVKAVRERLNGLFLSRGPSVLT